jgi:hypothetical protein
MSVYDIDQHERNREKKSTDSRMQEITTSDKLELTINKLNAERT